MQSVATSSLMGCYARAEGSCAVVVVALGSVSLSSLWASLYVDGEHRIPSGAVDWAAGLVLGIPTPLPSWCPLVLHERDAASRLTAFGRGERRRKWLCWLGRKIFFEEPHCLVQSMKLFSGCQQYGQYRQAGSASSDCQNVSTCTGPSFPFSSSLSPAAFLPS